MNRDRGHAHKELRIIVVGSSGAGKSTFGKSLGEVLRIPFKELDELHWEHGWKEADLEIFRERTHNFTSQTSWIVDGNYRKVNDIFWHKATHIVWLNTPFAVCLWRVTKRSLWRGLRREKLWNGNRESLRMFFSKQSLFVWVIQTWKKRRDEFLGMMERGEPTGVPWIVCRSLDESRKLFNLNAW